MSESKPTTRERRTEIAAAVLLSLTTVLTAWTAFQSAKWRGMQTTAYSEAAASRTESVRSSTLAGQQTSVDVNLFSTWVEATARDETDIADFFRERFREEFVPAFDAWIALEPLRNPDAPGSPFEMSEYQLAAADRATELEQAAAASSQAAEDANVRSNNYVLSTVLFAVVLFFVGVGTRFQSQRIRTALLVFASIGLVVGIAVLATFPIAL
jgi:hypothetical protein